MFNTLTMEPRTRIEDGSSRLFHSAFGLYCEGAKRYAVHVYQARAERYFRFEIYSVIYCNGRELPANHRADLRREALGQYCKAYGFKQDLECGPDMYRRDILAPSTKAAPFRPSAAMKAALQADLAAFRGE